jgi:hypothetical protein
MAEFQTAADIANRGADNAASRADTLAEYMDQQATPSPELAAAVQKWDKSYSRYTKRAAEFQKKADKIQAEEMAKAIQRIETEGQIAVEAIKAGGEANERQVDQLQTTIDTINAGMKNAANAESPEAKAAILTGTFGPYVQRVAQQNDMTPENVQLTLMSAIQAAAGGDLNEIMGFINLISAGRLGG